MSLSTVNGAPMSRPQVRLRYVCNIATGKVTAQSSNETKRLLKRGGYREVTGPDGGTVVERQVTPRKELAKAPTTAKEAKALLAVAIGCFLLAMAGLGFIALKARGYI